MITERANPSNSTFLINAHAEIVEIDNVLSSTTAGALRKLKTPNHSPKILRFILNVTELWRLNVADVGKEIITTRSEFESAVIQFVWVVGIEVDSYLHGVKLAYKNYFNCRFISIKIDFTANLRQLRSDELSYFSAQ